MRRAGEQLQPSRTGARGSSIRLQARKSPSGRTACPRQPGCRAAQRRMRAACRTPSWATPLRPGRPLSPSTPPSGRVTAGGGQAGGSTEARSAWATPVEVLLAAERAALLADRDDEFTMVVTIAYTGMRWGETIGLEQDLLLPALINVEWQLREIQGSFRPAPAEGRLIPQHELGAARTG